MPTLHNALESLGLVGLIETFEKEQIDFDSLVCSKVVCPIYRVLHLVDVF